MVAWCNPPCVMEIFLVGVVEKTTMLPQLGLGYRGSLHMSQQHGGVGDWEEAWRRDGGGEAAAAVGPRLPRVLAQVTAEASPGGLGSAARVTTRAVRSYRTISPLPTEVGGILSVALAVGSRPPDVIWHPVLWSPDFPPARHLLGAPNQRLSS